MAVESELFILDTNIVLYLLGDRLAEPVPLGNYAISIITEMELLAYPSLTEAQEQRILDFLNRLRIVDLNTEVKTAAISLRRQYGLKLPDAIIAATASMLEGILLTNDSRLLTMSDLKTRSLKLKSL